MNLTFTNEEFTKILAAGLEELGYMPEKEVRKASDKDYTLSVTYDGNKVTNYKLLGAILSIAPKEEPKQEVDTTYQPGSWKEDDECTSA